MKSREAGARADPQISIAVLQQRVDEIAGESVALRVRGPFAVLIMAQPAAIGAGPERSVVFCEQRFDDAVGRAGNKREFLILKMVEAGVCADPEGSIRSGCERPDGITGKAVLRCERADLPVFVAIQFFACADPDGAMLVLRDGA